MIDYSIFYKSDPARGDELTKLGPWDIFISAYNKSDRVNMVFDKIQAKEKHWLLNEEYGFKAEELPTKGDIYSAKSPCSESEYIIDFFETKFFARKINQEELRKKSLCIDSTGFIRPHLLYLILYLYKMGIESFHILYSEPHQYTAKEKTEFSKGAIEDVRFVDGFSEGTNRDSGADLLIVGAGFDHNLIAEVVDSKLNAQKEFIVGFPSLRPDMYQQCLLRISATDELLRDKKPNFAPANDPFITANVISELVARYDKDNKITNLYLSPLGTKAQVVGFVLFYIGECMNGQRDGGILFPISESYSQETSKGLEKTWSYQVQFPLV